MYDLIRELFTLGDEYRIAGANQHPTAGSGARDGAVGGAEPPTETARIFGALGGGAGIEVALPLPTPSSSMAGAPHSERLNSDEHLGSHEGSGRMGQAMEQHKIKEGEDATASRTVKSPRMPPLLLDLPEGLGLRSEVAAPDGSAAEQGDGSPGSTRTQGGGGGVIGTSGGAGGGANDDSKILRDLFEGEGGTPTSILNIHTYFHS